MLWINFDSEIMLRWGYFLPFQFNRYDPEDGKISERDFASMLLTYAGFPDKKKAIMLRRVKKIYKERENAKVVQSCMFELLQHYSKGNN